MELSDQQHKASDWVHEYSDMLFNYAAQRVPDVHTAKDIVQETFLAAWRNIANYNREASVKTWLFTILKNKLIDHYRKISTRVTEEISATAQADRLYFDEADHWTEKAYPADWGVAYDNPIESKEFYMILDNCKKKLREIQNVVFSMKYLDGYDSDEICRSLQLSNSNYWVLIHRAKTQLRGCLEKNWFLK